MERMTSKPPPHPGVADRLTELVGRIILGKLIGEPIGWKITVNCTRLEIRAPPI